jgi:vacuolar iron transporter family protein
MHEHKNNPTLLTAQRFEVTEYEIYKRLVLITSNQNNREVLQSLAEGSKKHALYWEKITEIQVKPSRLKMFVYTCIFRFLGLTFGIKLMEASEKSAETLIFNIVHKYPEHKWILEEEKTHEQKLIALIDESFINYTGSLVLGANDSIVSTVGTAAGLSVALSSVHLIGMTSFISGATAALSMSSSAYLQSLSEKSNRNPLTAGIYTGITYIVTVLILIVPYFLVEQHYVALFATLAISAVVITVISFYISIIQQTSFIKRFLQNIVLSFGIAVISFLIGFLINKFFGLQV